MLSFNITEWSKYSFMSANNLYFTEKLVAIYIPSYNLGIIQYVNQINKRTDNLE